MQNSSARIKRVTGSHEAARNRETPNTPAESLQHTQSLFAENHEPFFNSIGPERHFASANDRIAKGSLDYLVGDTAKRLTFAMHVGF